MHLPLAVLLLSLSYLLLIAQEGAAVKSAVRKRHAPQGEPPKLLDKPHRRKAQSVLEEQELALAPHADEQPQRSKRRSYEAHFARLEAEMLQRLANETMPEQQPEDKVIRENGKVALIHTADNWLVAVERMHVWRTGDWRTSKCYFTMPFHPDNVVLARRLMGHVSQADDYQSIRRKLDTAVQRSGAGEVVANHWTKRYLEPFYIVFVARYLQTVILRLLLRVLCVMSTTWACDARGGSFNMSMLELAFYGLVTVLAPRVSHTLLPVHYLVLAMYAVNAEVYLAWFSGKQDIPSASALKGVDYLPLLSLQLITTSYLDAFVAKHFSPDRRPLHRRFFQGMFTMRRRMLQGAPQ